MSARQNLRFKRVAEFWRALSEQRLEWALRAYRRFVDSLSDETRDRLARGDVNSEAYVVVFGKTQVGKTTLLLDLMGVSPQELPRVSRVLRGGREQGRSATATTMEYRCSPDDCWRLDTGYGPQIIGDDDLMEQQLAELRERMSKHHLPADMPVMVWIPINCFSTGEVSGPGVRMLDLPGDNPADQVEREHVQSMARRYVPHADLILLVGRGDDLSFLCPQALALPSIEDWQIVPARFRIVTTYSFTPQSVRELARQNLGRLNADFFRERLQEQIATFGLELTDDSRQLHRYFPLEFGDSWLDAQRYRDELVEQLEPIIAGLKQQLHADILGSATEMSRLRNAVDVHLVVRRVKETRLRKMDEELQGLHQRLKCTQDHRQRAADALQGASSETLDKQVFLQSVTLQEILRDVQSLGSINIENQLSRVGRLDTNVGALRSLIAEFSSDLTRQFLSLHPPADGQVKKEFWRAVHPRIEGHRVQVIKRISREFSGLQKRLDGHWIDEYFPSVSDDFSNDKSRLRTDMHDAARAVGQLAIEVWTPLAQSRMATVDAEYASARASEATLATALERENADLVQALADITRHMQERADFISKMDADEESGRTFIRMLDEEYLDELKARRKVRFEALNPTSSLLNLLAEFQLTGVREKLKIGMQ